MGRGQAGDRVERPMRPTLIAFLNAPLRASGFAVVLMNLLLLSAVLVFVAKLPYGEEARAAILDGPVFGRGGTYLNHSLHLFATVKFAVSLGASPRTRWCALWLAAVGATTWLLGSSGFGLVILIGLFLVPENWAPQNRVLKDRGHRKGRADEAA